MREVEGLRQLHHKTRHSRSTTPALQIRVLLSYQRIQNQKTVEVHQQPTTVNYIHQYVVPTSNAPVVKDGVTDQARSGGENHGENWIERASDAGESQVSR